MFGRGVELSARADFRTHKGLGGSGLSQRERRHISSFIGTGVASPRYRQERILRELKDNTVMRVNIADIAKVIKVPTGYRAIDLIGLSAHDLLHIPRCDLFFRNNGLRDCVVIFNHFAGHDLHEGLHALFIPVGGTATIGLIGFAEIEVRVITGLSGFIGSHLDGVFHQIGRGDDVFLIVQIHIGQRVRIGKERHFVILDFTGQITVTAQNRHLPGFIVVSKGVRTALMRIAILFNQLNGNLDSLASGMGALCGDAANAVTHAAILYLLIFFNRVTTVIGCDENARFI